MLEEELNTAHGVSLDEATSGTTGKLAFHASANQTGYAGKE